MCDKNPHCFNSKTLVLDTNFLDQVNRIIKEELGSFALGKALEEQRPIFLTRAKNIVENIGRCGGGHIFTSDKVYNDEIDVLKLDSALRAGNLGFFDNLCLDEEFSKNLSTIYLEKIDVRGMSENEVQAFQGMLTEDVGYGDTSLALLGLELSQDQEAILITDDLMLQKTIKDLIKRDRITLERRSLATKNIHCMGSLIFLIESNISNATGDHHEKPIKQVRMMGSHCITFAVLYNSLHSCCAMPNNRWRSAILSFTKHQIERYETGTISEETYKIQCGYGDQCWAQVHTECEEKRKREERNEDYRLFGVSDG